MDVFLFFGPLVGFSWCIVWSFSHVIYIKDKNQTSKEVSFFRPSGEYPRSKYQIVSGGSFCLRLSQGGVNKLETGDL